MATLVWDQVGERVYQTGLDRGVLYLPDGSGVPWNGLISVTEGSTQEVKPFYLDGVKYLEHHIPGDYTAELKAYTYPDEFDDINGIVFDDGLFFHDQPPKSFGLSYRTLIGDDVDGLDRAYKIHIVWGVKANPANSAYMSLSNQDNPLQFVWNLSGVPSVLSGFKPTCHVTIDSDKIEPDILGVIEDKLYGTDTTDPALPSLAELYVLDQVMIIDNGDGTWTAVGPDLFITMLDSTTFQITEANATYLDANTYTISDSVS